MPQLWPGNNKESRLVLSKLWEIGEAQGKSGQNNDADWEWVAWGVITVSLFVWRFNKITKNLLEKVGASQKKYMESVEKAN